MTENENHDSTELNESEAQTDASLEGEIVEGENTVSEDVESESAEYAEPALEAALEPAFESAAEYTEPASEPAAEVDIAAEPTLPPHFEPIPQEKLKRAKRTKRILLVVIILLVLVLLAAGAGAVYYYITYGESPTTVETTPVDIEVSEDIQDRGTTETIDMPNLAQMFGKTPEEVLTSLGSDYSISKTEVFEEEAAAEEPAEGAAEDTAEDTAQSGISARVTIAYSPEDGSGSASNAQTQSIYLDLNEQGVVAEIYFSSSMNLLDYPISSFDALVESKNSFVQSMQSAGITVPQDIEYSAPLSEDYTEYVDPEASILKIKKQSFSFAGTLGAEQAPTSFEISYTYDYGSTGVEDTPDKQPIDRRIVIKLS